MARLDIRHLVKTFPPDVRAVDGVSFTVEAGEIICLLGPSGCGKTTLLRMVAGLEQPDSGEIWYGDQEMSAVPPHKRNFGMMFQDFALFPHKNVFDNVAFGLRMHGRSPTEIQSRVMEMLALVELQTLEKRTIDQLSGGQQQRVALARALAPGPRLLMLDEPLGSLDRALRERLMLELRNILKGIGVTALYVTHDQTEAFAVSDRMAVMNAGRVEQLDRPERVYRQPATPFVARFLGLQNLIAAEVSGSGEVLTAIGRFQVNTRGLRPGSAVTLLIWPQAEAMGTADEAATSNRSNVIEGVVEAVAFRGRYYQLWLRVGEERLLFEQPTVEEIRPEARVWVQPGEEQLILIPQDLRS
jgi:ABC-type Fe3+/spermidine/putrescine transport system ATPase subunit